MQREPAHTTRSMIHPFVHSSRHCNTNTTPCHPFPPPSAAFARHPQAANHLVVASLPGRLVSGYRCQGFLWRGKAGRTGSRGAEGQ